MIYIALYWGVMLVGYFIGSKMRHLENTQPVVDTAMNVCISLLVLIMGLRMGSDEEVISNFGTIGLESLIITVALAAGAVFAVTLTRKIIGLDKWGRVIKGAGAGHAIEETDELDNLEKEEEAEEKGKHTMSILIIVFVVLGLLAGYFFVRTMVKDMNAFSTITGNTMTVGLCIMLLFIGFGMGIEGTVINQLKTIGFRVLIFPIAVLIGTAVVAVVIGLVVPSLTVRESLAVSFGFGWYTFAPVSIANAGHVIAGAVSFMHNVFRELGGLMLIPILAKHIGYIEATALPGVAGMDICMPVVIKATRQDIIVYSFTIGIFESLMVPLLVPLAIG